MESKLMSSRQAWCYLFLSKASTPSRGQILTVDYTLCLISILIITGKVHMLMSFRLILKISYKECAAMKAYKG